MVSSIEKNGKNLFGAKFILTAGNSSFSFFYLIRPVLLFFVLEAACRAIDGVPNVLERSGVGRPRFDSRSRIVGVLVKAWLGRSYRDVEVYLHDNRETLTQFSLEVPVHM